MTPVEYLETDEYISEKFRTRRYRTHQRKIIELFTDHEFSQQGLEERGQSSEEEVLYEIGRDNLNGVGCDICGEDPVIIYPEASNVDAA